MKRFAIVAILIGIGAVPALAQDPQFNFTYSSAVETATGTLLGTEIGNTGDYQITGGMISITGSAFSGTGGITNPADCCGADNELYVAGNGPNSVYLDVGGLLFSTTNGLNNLWGGDNNGYNNLSGTNYSLSGNNGNYIDYPGTFTISQVPEGGSAALYLLLAAATILGAIFLSSCQKLAGRA
jgi:hypothetical protein